MDRDYPALKPKENSTIYVLTISKLLYIMKRA